MTLVVKGLMMDDQVEYPKVLSEGPMRALLLDSVQYSLLLAVRTLLTQQICLSLLLFYVLATSKVISG